MKDRTKGEGGRWISQRIRHAESVTGRATFPWRNPDQTMTLPDGSKSSAWAAKDLVILTGNVSPDSRIGRRIRANGWGRMFNKGDNQKFVQPWDGEPWGLDNGVYADYTKGKPFDELDFQRRLDQLYATGSLPYLSVVPDICGGQGIGAAMRSLEFSCRWVEKMPTEWPKYLVLQDGMTAPQEVGSVINLFDGLFLGGIKIKAAACYWAAVAHMHGIPFHYGRCGTLRKVRHARDAQADSLDSTFPLWTRRRFDDFQAWLTEPDPQMKLFEDERAALRES